MKNNGLRKGDLEFIGQNGQQRSPLQQQRRALVADVVPLHRRVLASLDGGDGAGTHVTLRLRKNTHKQTAKIKKQMRYNNINQERSIPARLDRLKFRRKPLAGLHRSAAALEVAARPVGGRL
jgi:hypothetical protein